jgi:adenosylhomocysteine nucleosidase
MERREIGFVVGLAAEAALLQGRGFAVGIGGGTPAGARVAAQALLAEGAAALVSFGLAGGLDPALPPGALVVPRGVMSGSALYVCAPALTSLFGGTTADRIYAGAGIAATAVQKSTLFAQTGAAAVDLESGAVAGIAAEQGRPLAVLRAIVDAASVDLPPAACLALGPGGRVALPGILASVLRQPGQIAGLLRLARDAARARRTLLAALAALGNPNPG